jgi:type I restriction enzyme S subunit
MKWEKVKLGEVSRVSSSKRIFARQYVRKGVPFYRQKEIIDKKNKNFIIDPLFISVETYNEIKKKFGVPVKGDLLITAVGVTLGIPYIVDDEIFYFKDGNLIWLSNFNENINSKYIYYWITSDIGQKMMWSRVIGSAQPALTIDIIKQFELSIPTYILQNKIVKILETYDDLIENNQKQIKLLEEAAQRLYKEWFVNLRFPGYENTPIIDGVPEGWSKGCVGDIAVFKRGKTITKTQIVEGNVPVVAGGIEPAYYHNKANTIAPVITVSASGANAGFTKLYYNNVFASDCSFADAKITPCLYYIYAFLKDNKLSIDALQKGSAQPHVYAKDINAMGLIIPCKQLILDYCYCVSGIFSKIKILFDQINKLTEARDRVLSKLVNGEIEG